MLSPLYVLEPMFYTYNVGLVYIIELILLKYFITYSYQNNKHILYIVPIVPQKNMRLGQAHQPHYMLIILDLYSFSLSNLFMYH